MFDKCNSLFFLFHLQSFLFFQESANEVPPKTKRFSVFTCEVASGSVIIAENLEPERSGKRKTLTAGKFNGSS